MKQEYDIDVHWMGWELHPEFPAEGQPRRAFGGPRMNAVQESVQQMADEAGLVIKAPDPLANTHLALQAAEFARDEGLFDEFHRRLFEAYFAEEKNIGDRTVLFAEARQVGLDVARLEEALSSRRYESRLSEARDEALELGANGIPTFQIGEIWLVGAMPIEVMRRMVERGGGKKLCE